MLEIFLLCTYLIGHEPEMILFMLYIVMFIWGSAMRSASYPVYAPHILDVLKAETAAVAASGATGTAAREMTVEARYCGKTIGDIAATCGISLACSVYFDFRRFRPSNGWIDPKTKRHYQKKLRLSYSWALGHVVNAVSDVERWWESRSRRSVPTEEAAERTPVK